MIFLFIFSLTLAALSDILTTMNQQTRDITGETLGKLFVIGKSDTHDIPSHQKWKCVCKCGAHCEKAYSHLVYGSIKSCGRQSCKQVPLPDLGGKPFGRLVVIGRSNVKADKASYQKWVCVCQCGNRCEVRYGSLVSGRTRSCGCLAQEAKKWITRNLLGPKGTIFHYFKNGCWQ